MPVCLSLYRMQFGDPEEHDRISDCAALGIGVSHPGLAAELDVVGMA